LRISRVWRTLGARKDGLVAEEKPQVMGWGTLIAIVVGTGLAVGMSLGLLGGALGISSSWFGSGAGGSMGVVGALLIARRQRALAAQNKA